MNELMQSKLKKRYLAAADSFVDKVRDDPNVIAVIISGSLTYDTIWEKSDIDMTLVVRDQHLSNDSYCIMEDGITVNVYLIQRSSFKRGLERSIGGSFMQSYFSKGEIIYTTDDSLYEYFEEFKKPGSDDIALSVMFIACELAHLLDKCNKWLIARNDLLYAQYYVLKAAESVARMEVCLNMGTPGRDCIQKALHLNPDIMAPLYTHAMSCHLNEDEIIKDIKLIDGYLEEHLDIFQKPVLDFMSDQQIKTVTILSKHFHQESHFIIGIFDYLVEKRVIEKVSQTIRITPKSKLAVEELGYLYIPL